MLAFEKMVNCKNNWVKDKKQYNTISKMMFPQVLRIYAMFCFPILCYLQKMILQQY